MKTEDIPERVLSAYRKYEAIQEADNTHAHSNDDDYKKGQRKINRAYNTFVKECEKFGLNYIEVNSILIPNKIILSR